MANLANLNGIRLPFLEVVTIRTALKAETTRF